MEYKLFWGCTIPARIPFVENSARKVFKKIGLNYSDLEDTTCCPDPTGLPAVDQKTWLTLGARNLSLVNDYNNSTVISLCSGCVETLKTVNHILNVHGDKREEVNKYLTKIGKKFSGNVPVKHVGQLIYENLDEIKKYVVKPLKGFKVAVHYGCHFLRPSEIIEWDDPDNPKTLDEIVTALGGESIPYDNKLECCGCPVGKSDEELSNKITMQKLQGVADSGANCMLVVCPACFTHLDFKQKSLNKEMETQFDYPVFYLTELLALAMGFKPKDLGVRYHVVKAKKLLLELGFMD
ncbi:MAG: hypothetical protein GF364_22500 [Candidatus Lokiarchaeota archaeon]|nr:hypothetical protein [Candidatus Lokiarchaeota archaeon]